MKVYKRHAFTNRHWMPSAGTQGTPSAAQPHYPHNNPQPLPKELVLSNQSIST